MLCNMSRVALETKVTASVSFKKAWFSNLFVFINAELRTDMCPISKTLTVAVKIKQVVKKLSP